MVDLAKGEWLDYALVIGMTPDEYWFGDPGLIYNYAEKYRIERTIRENELWAAGRYFQAALASTILIAGLADKDVARKMPKYPETPPSQSADNKNALSARNIEAEQTRAKAYFNALMRANNKK